MKFIFTFILFTAITLCPGERSYAAATKYGDSTAQEKKLPGTYAGELPDRWPLGEGSPAAGATVWLELKKNYKCIYKTDSHILCGKWTLQTDTLSLIFTREKGTGHDFHHENEGIDFNMKFIVGDEGCLWPVRAKVKFCKRGRQ